LPLGCGICGPRAAASSGLIPCGTAAPGVPGAASAAPEAALDGL